MLYNTTSIILFFFFFNDTATTEIYTLSLHDALPILHRKGDLEAAGGAPYLAALADGKPKVSNVEHYARSEEHTSELQSRSDLVCRLLLEKKKTNTVTFSTNRRFVSSLVTRP